MHVSVSCLLLDGTHAVLMTDRLPVLGQCKKELRYIVSIMFPGKRKLLKITQRLVRCSPQAGAGVSE